MIDEVEDRVLYEKIGTCGKKVKSPDIPEKLHFC